MRLRADFWVAAHIRRCEVEGASAYLRRRGSPEAGAIIVKLDKLDGETALYGVATSTDPDRDMDRRFIRLHKEAWIDPPDAEARLKREIGFDPDLWILEIEDRQGDRFWMSSSDAELRAVSATIVCAAKGALNSCLNNRHAHYFAAEVERSRTPDTLFTHGTSC